MQNESGIDIDVLLGSLAGAEHVFHEQAAIDTDSNACDETKYGMTPVYNSAARPTVAPNCLVKTIIMNVNELDETSDKYRVLHVLSNYVQERLHINSLKADWNDKLCKKLNRMGYMGSDDTPPFSTNLDEACNLQISYLIHHISAGIYPPKGIFRVIKHTLDHAPQKTQFQTSPSPAQ